MARASLTLNTKADREKAAAWVWQAPWGARVDFKEVKRSLDQNAKLWVCLTYIAQQVIWYGQKLTPNDWKDMFTASLRKARVVPGIDPGSFVLLGLHTSDMSKEEMSNLLELVHAFAAERGVNLQDQEKAA